MKKYAHSDIELSEAHAEGFYEISQAAQLSGINAKMIRHYESIGLIPPVKRTLANYRIYSQSDIQKLSFIKRSRSLGFSLEQIKTLLALWNNEHRASADVKRLVLAHVQDLDNKILEMQEMSRALRQLAVDCCGNQDPDCPILDGLSQTDHH
jgi:MerR family copper efflux transcriptional regulator